MMEISPSSRICEQFGTLGLGTETNEPNDAASLEFYETIPSLQEMSSIVVAIESWRHFITKEDPKRDTHYNPEYVFYFLTEGDEKEVENLLHDLPLPRLIRDLVVERLGPVKHEMNAWARYYVQSVFCSKRYDLEGAIKISDLMFCHWLPDGKIDHRKSALNMLSNARLTMADKFKIMCKYCLEEEMKQLPSHSIAENSNAVAGFYKNPLMNYWLCRMSNNSDEVPKINGESFEAFLITTPGVDSWASIEYFWNRLNANQQVSKALILLNRKSQFQKQIFSKMNEAQKRRVLSTMPIDIVKNFWLQTSCERFAFLSWIHGVKTMSYEQFASLIEDLLSVSLPHHEERISYLVKMWNCSPEHFKTRAVQSISKKVIFLHTEICWTRWEDDSFLPSNLDFLLAFLASANVEFRKEILFRHVDKFVLRNDSPMIDQLVKLCLPNIIDVVEFRNFLFNSPKVQSDCYDMLVGSFDDRQHLAKFLLNYFPNPVAKGDFINMLVSLQSWSDDSMENWNDAITLIKVNLDVEPDEAKILKKRIIWSFATTRVQFAWNLHHVRQFIAMVTSVLDTEELEKYKITALETFRNRYEWFEFREDDIRGFFVWCFDADEQKIRQFKTSLPIDAIFEYYWKVWERDGFLEKELGSDEMCQKFARLNKILLWCFEKSDDVKAYKLRKAFDLFECASLEMNHVFALNVLPWFFDGEREELMKFRERLKGDSVIEIIDFLLMPVSM